MRRAGVMAAAEERGWVNAAAVRINRRRLKKLARVERAKKDRAVPARKKGEER